MCACGDHLWTADSTGATADTAAVMAAGTSAAVAR